VIAQDGRKEGKKEEKGKRRRGKVKAAKAKASLMQKRRGTVAFSSRIQWQRRQQSTAASNSVDGW